MLVPPLRLYLVVPRMLRAKFGRDLLNRCEISKIAQPIPRLTEATLSVGETPLGVFFLIGIQWSQIEEDHGFFLGLVSYMKIMASRGSTQKHCSKP